MSYTPRIYINGVHLANAKVHEVRDMGDWVNSVYIEAPAYDIKRVEDEG